MLSRADQDLARRDVDLPGLACLLDSDAVAEDLVGLGLRGLDEVAPDYVRYKPGSSCLVGYALRIEGETFRAHAKIHADRLGPKAEKARAQAGSRLEPGVMSRRGGAVLLERSRAVFAFFPFDADLPALGRFEDADLGPRLRARVFRHLADPPREALDVLAYKPERRLVGRLPSTSGPDHVVRFYASAAHERRNRQTRRLPNGECLRLAKHVGGSKAYRITVLEWLTGSNLRDFIRFDATKAGEALEPVARALAEFHEAAVVAPERFPTSDPRRGVFEFARTLGWLAPGSARSADRLARLLVSELSRFRFERRILHGDLYDKQIILMDPGVGLLDLDQVAVGDPREDLALLLAHWERDRIVGDLGAWQEEIASALVGHYERATDRACVGLSVFVAAALFRLAQHPFRNRLADWPRIVDSILVRVGELLDRP